MVELIFFFALLIALIPIMGNYIAKIFSREKIGYLEAYVYKIIAIDPKEEMNWIDYAKALFVFNLLGFLFLFLLLISQGFLPLNPQNLSSMPLDLAFNTAISFTTNTNWQAYAGETTLSYLSQMAGLAVQNFLSAATGFAVFFVLARGLTRKTTEMLGNFWQDLVRVMLYILLPLSFIFAIVLLTEGVPQSFSPYVEVETLEGAKQIIPLGPVASQVAIKQLGTNGGGFFNTNSAHPFENPTPFSNLLQNLAIILIPAASFYAYGVIIGSKRDGWLSIILMTTMLCVGFILSLVSEEHYNPILKAFPLMEGKEVRFGEAGSLLWSTATTATSNGSVNAMLSSLSPLASGISLFGIMIGEVTFGGVGVGVCKISFFIILTVFLSGLMVGRTPEYLGKKIEKREIQWVVIGILLPGALILIGSGISFALPTALSSLKNEGPHGFTEILYAFSSAAENNGSSFAGLNSNTLYYNLFLGILMVIGRFSSILPCLAIAGLLAKKKITPASTGTFSTNSVLFIILLAGCIFIIGALTFFPALALGPIMEHFLMVRSV